MKKSLLAGLDLPDLDKKPEPAAPAEATAGLFIPLEAIEPDPDQPRRMSAEDDDDLKMLAESILQHGVLQPITVSSLGQGRYQIVSGERRWRAAQLALQTGTPCVRKGYDLKRIPVFIRDPEDAKDRLEMQMVENLARADMSDVDIGAALNRLLRETGISKAEMGRRLGRSPTWVGTVLAKSSPEALELAERIGVPPEVIGAGDTMRMLSWANDDDKGAVLDAIAAQIKAGRAYNRALLDDEEERYEITFRFPTLASRTDLSLDDLRTWKGFWEAADEGKRAIADRVLAGMSLTEAMQVTVKPAAPVDEPDDYEEAPDEAPLMASVAEYIEAGKIEDDFDVADQEAVDAVAARVSLADRPIVAPDEKSLADRPIVAPDEKTRVFVDAGGLSMESGSGSTLTTPTQNVSVVVRIPGDAVRRILEKAGVSDDLTVDPETVLDAILRLV